MKPSLTKRSVITVDMLRVDRTLCPNIRGEIHTGLRGDVSGLSGDVFGLSGNVTGLRGDVSGLGGDVSGLSGNVTGLHGDVDLCDISQADREAGVDIKTLILPA